MNLCSACKAREGTEQLPKTYDFNRVHAMKRLNVTPKVREVDFQKFTYYFDSPEERAKWYADNPNWMVTDWINVCPECKPHMHLSTGAFERIMHRMEKEIGTEKLDEIVKSHAVRVALDAIEGDYFNEAVKKHELDERRLDRTVKKLMGGSA